MSHIFRAFAVLAMLGSFALAQNAGSTQTDPAAKPSPIPNASSPQDQQSQQANKQKKHKKMKDSANQGTKADAANPNISTGKESPHTGVSGDQTEEQKQNPPQTAPQPNPSQTNPQPNPPQR